MRLKNLDLVAAMIAVVLNVAWTQIPGQIPVVGSLLTLPLTLFLPGYTLVQVLFRRREPVSEASHLIRQPGRKTEDAPGKIDQVMLSFGLSMTIDVLVGFGLNILPIGLQRLSWVLSLGLLTIVFAVVAILLRRKDIPGTARPSHSLKSGRVQIAFQDCIFFLLAILVGISAGWLALIRPLNPQSGFTQFWMLPADQVNKTCEVSIGIQSFETTSETYRVVIAVDKAQIHAWSPIVLPPQQKWIQPVIFTPGAASSLSIESWLYRKDKPDRVYRNVHLTFSVSTYAVNTSTQRQCVLRM